MSGDGKSSISQASSYREMGDYWDTHDLGEIWDQTEPVEMEIDLRSDRRYYPVEQTLAQRISAIARDRGVTTETLVNLWLQEKLATAG